MIKLRSWIAVAALAGSWMFGLGYFYPADFSAWAILIAAGAILLFGTKVPSPSPREMATVEELYLAGLRLEQFHNGNVDPLPYYDEALRRVDHYDAIARHDDMDAAPQTQPGTSTDPDTAPVGIGPQTGSGRRNGDQ